MMSGIYNNSSGNSSSNSSVVVAATIAIAMAIVIALAIAVAQLRSAVEYSTALLESPSLSLLKFDVVVPSKVLVLSLEAC